MEPKNLAEDSVENGSPFRSKIEAPFRWVPFSEARPKCTAVRAYMYPKCTVILWDPLSLGNSRVWL
jgi:hypothetical protein